MEHIVSYWSLFLDDIRNPPEKIHPAPVVARTMDEAIHYITRVYKRLPNHIFFDHDLGEETHKDSSGLLIPTGNIHPTGYDFAKWLLKKVTLKEYALPEPFSYSIHSMNPVGANNIAETMNYLRERNRR